MAYLQLEVTCHRYLRKVEFHTEMRPIKTDDTRPVLTGMSLAELKDLMLAMGEKGFRAVQVHEWIYAKRATSFLEMTSLPHALRERLEQETRLRRLRLVDQQHSEDGTIKFLFRTDDNLNIESVLIPSEARDTGNEPKRRTLCLSSQVGCPLDCKFCATASMKLKRNLTAGEILEQHLQVEERVGERITNIVYMGMGEPMLNLTEVLDSIAIFTDPTNELVGASRITVSTSGVVPGILRMAEEGSRVKLAISLHMTTENERSRLMPINRKYPLAEVMQAVETYYRKTRRPVTYEYILFDGMNDTPEDARRLARIARRVPSKVNVIPFHPIDFTDPQGISAELVPASDEGVDRFNALLRREGAQVMVRSSSGVDIDAACGQLAIRHTESSL